MSFLTRIKRMFSKTYLEYDDYMNQVKTLEYVMFRHDTAKQSLRNLSRKEART